MCLLFDGSMSSENLTDDPHQSSPPLVTKAQEPETLDPNSLSLRLGEDVTLTLGADSLLIAGMIH